MSIDDAAPAAATELLGRIESGDAEVGVVGLGYIGLPFAGACVDAGLMVRGYDTDDEKIALLERGESYLPHLEGLAESLAASGRFRPTGSARELCGADVVVLCVPTPLGRHREPDLTYVHRSSRMVAEHLRAGQLVILTSTTYPGTTRDEVLPILESSGLAVGRDVFLAYSPERENPGSGQRTAAIPKLVGGVDPWSERLAVALLSRVVEAVHPVASAEVAEAAKLLENVYRAVNIALVNELKLLFDRLGLDVWQVIAAASTKPFGFQAFYPGPGLGGHCIPIDPFYLTWKAKEVGMSTRFIELAGEVNAAMPEHVANRVAEALNSRGKPLRGARILVLGIAYKPNVGDVRETPAAPIVERLQAGGAEVAYHDPHVPVFPDMRHHHIELRSLPLDGELLAAQDCVLVLTDHAAIDWRLVAERASLVVDTRNVVRAGGGATVIRA
jgi:UDP-N-acetyl-D-glucosamine dehydrogenase